jgi:D-alanyl-D-alanine carboxypeptidase
MRRRSAVLGCLAAGALAAPAASAATGPVPNLDPAALEVMNQPAYANGQWFMSVRDLDTGAQLIDLNAGALVEPGSVVKTYSMGAGWLRFGPDHRVTTPVKRRGTVAGGTLRGDLVLVAKGDMTMDGRTKPDGTVDFTNLDHNDANDLPGATLTPENPLTGLNRLAQQVRRSGIRRVTGDVVVDDRLWETFQLNPNGPVTPIIINNNLIDFTTTPSRPGRPASIVMRPKVAPWKVTNEVRTVAKGKDTQIKVTSPRHGAHRGARAGRRHRAGQRHQAQPGPQPAVDACRGRPPRRRAPALAAARGGGQVRPEGLLQPRRADDDLPARRGRGQHGVQRRPGEGPADLEGRRPGHRRRRPHRRLGPDR